MIVTTLGERIRAYRLARNWSQEELADVAGISRSEIGRLERDEVIYPMHETVAKTGKVLRHAAGNNVLCIPGQ